MDLVTAERIAAATAGVTYGQAAVVIEEVLRQLSKCDLCQDTGKFTTTRAVTVELHQWNQQARLHAGYLPQGTEIQCPRCFTGDGDPRWVQWYCVFESSECKHRQFEGVWRLTHSNCGLRVSLPCPKGGRLVPEERFSGTTPGTSVVLDGIGDSDADETPVRD